MRNVVLQFSLSVKPISNLPNRPCRQSEICHQYAIHLIHVRDTLAMMVAKPPTKSEQSNVTISICWDSVDAWHKRQMCATNEWNGRCWYWNSRFVTLWTLDPFSSFRSIPQNFYPSIISLKWNTHKDLWRKRVFKGVFAFAISEYLSLSLSYSVYILLFLISLIINL